MLTGRCGCGAVTYTAKARPLIVHCCHCSDCQRQTGSAFVLNAILETAHVRIEGAVSEHTLPTPSGKGQVIKRCRHCGVAVVSAYMTRLGKLSYIRVGTLDDPSACPPDVQIYTASKQDWVPLNPDIPVFETYYDIKAVWPEDSLARWQAVFGELP